MGINSCHMTPLGAASSSYSGQRVPSYKCLTLLSKCRNGNQNNERLGEKEKKVILPLGIYIDYSTSDKFQPCALSHDLIRTCTRLYGYGKFI